MFTNLAESQELSDKLDIFVACAPIVNLRNQEEPMLARTSSQWWYIQDTLKKLKIYEIRDPKVDSSLRGFCNTFGPVCDAVQNWFHLNSPYGDTAAMDLENSLPNSSASSK